MLRPAPLSLGATLAAALLSLGAPAAGAQAGPLAARVAASSAPAVEFRFPSRPGVCGDGRSFLRTSAHSYMGTYTDGMDARECVAGPVRVVVRHAGGAVTDVHAYVGPEPAPSGDITDLGTVSAADGSAFLLSLLDSDDQRVADRAVVPALLGDGVVAWPALLRAARRDAGDGRKRHHEALFWLGRYAAARAAYHSDDPFVNDARDDDADEVETTKTHAVFALSQLPRGEGIEPLLGVARTNRDPAVRSRAIFWLGESGDPRAVDLFAELLGASR